MRNLALILTIALLSSSLKAQTVYEIYPSDGASGDYFGNIVTISGEYAIAGSECDDDFGDASGSAYIFVRNGNAWIEHQKITPDDLEALDMFGIAVSIKDEYALIGSPGDDDLGDRSGAAYVYYRDDDTWVEHQKLFANDGEEGQRFGFQVALDGDYAIIGTREGYWNMNWIGSAYIFKREDDEWIEQVKLMPDDIDEWDKFACSVSISGDYAVVGACRNDEGITWSGSAYVFKRTTDRIQETWIQQQKLFALDADVNDYFGISVAISGNHIIIGAYGDDDQGDFSGSAYIFKLEDDEWIQQQKIIGSEVGFEDSFGEYVAISGNRAIVGVRRDDDHGSNSGACYVFELIDDVWTETHKLTAYDGFTLDLFGVAVDIDGDRTIVGTRGYHPITGLWTGTAYIYDFSPENPVPVTLTPQNPPVMIPAAGGSFTYDIEIVNFFNYAIQPSIWLVAERPRQFTQLIELQTLYIPPADTISTTLTQFVPDIAPHGHYHFIANLGDWADSVIISEDHFDFVKFPGDDLAHAAHNSDARVARIAGQVGFHKENHRVARDKGVARDFSTGFHDGRPGSPNPANRRGNPRTTEGPGYLDGHRINPVCQQTGPPVKAVPSGPQRSGDLTAAVGWDVLGWDLLCGELASGVDDISPDHRRSGLHPSDMKPNLTSKSGHPSPPLPGSENPAYIFASKQGHTYPPGSENQAYHPLEQTLFASEQGHTLLPLEFSLEPAWPNPFNPSTTVTIALPEASGLRVAVFNTLGREVAVLADSHYPSGHHHFTFNAGRDLPAGIYFIHAVSSSGCSEVQKVVLVR